MLIKLPVSAETSWSGKCGNNLTWTQKTDGELVISGSGDMYDYDDGDTPWGKVIKKLTINEGVTSIGDYAFKGVDLTEVSFPNTLKSIGYEAFYNTYKLKSVYIPGAVTQIGTYAFGYSRELSSIEVSDDNPNYCSDGKALYNKNKTTLYQYALANDDGYYAVPNSVKLLYCVSFACASNLQALYVPSENVRAMTYTFYMCDFDVYCYGTTELYEQYADKADSIKIRDISSYDELVKMSDVTVEIDESGCVYDGKEKRPDVIVKYGKKLLTAGIEYDVDYKDNVYAGTAYVIITGRNGYLGTKKVPFTIKGKSLENAEIKIDTTDIFSTRLTYTGDEQKPYIKVTLDGDSLWEGTHYTVEYTDNINPGTAKVTIYGKGNYAGEKTATFTIYDVNDNLDYELITVDGEKVTTTAEGKPKIIILSNTDCGAPRNIFECIVDNQNVFDKYDIIAINLDESGDEELKKYRDSFGQIPVKFCNDTDELVGYWYGVEFGMRWGATIPFLIFVDENNKMVNHLDQSHYENLDKKVELLFAGVPQDEIVVETSGDEQKSCDTCTSEKSTVVDSKNVNPTIEEKKNLTDTKPKYSKIKIKKKSIELCAGCKGEIEYTGGSDEVKYSSSDNSIASVTKLGIVKAKKKGKTTITVTDLCTGKQCICKVTVKKRVNKKEVSKKIKQLKRKYPEGKKWSDSNHDKYGNSGCYAYMTKVAEYLYGKDAKSTRHYSFKKIKVGDHIRINESHSVVVIKKNSNSVVVTEGNYYSSIHWGRELTKSYFKQRDFYVDTWY